MELKQYFDAIKKWWWLVVASTLVATVSGYIGVSRMPRIYQASATVMVGQGMEKANPTDQDLYISQRLAQTYREMVTRRPILSGAAEMLGLPYVPSSENVNAWLVPGTNLMGIAVRDTDRERARALADAIVQQLIATTPNEIAEDQARQEFVRTQLRQLEVNIQVAEEEIRAEQAKLDAANSARAIQQYQTNIAALQQKLSSYQATYGSLLGSVEGRTNYISVFEPASTPTRPISPNVRMTVLMAAAIGMALAVGGALLIEFLDDTVKSADDVKKLTGLTVLGTIARIGGTNLEEKLIHVEEAPSLILEAYRSLRTSLLISSVDEPIRTLLVTSPVPSDGKSTTVANLGVVMAQAGKSVILVDADLRRSSLHKFFQVSNRQGLTHVLLQDEPTVDGWLQETGIDNLRLLTSGPLPPNPPELLGSQKMRRLVENLMQEADLIIFDAPPSLAVTDATVLAMMANGVLVVTDSERTRRGALRQAVEGLRQSGANLLGVVLNRVSNGGGDYYYYRYDYSSHKPGLRSRVLGRLRRREKPVEGVQPLGGTREAEPAMATRAHAEEPAPEPEKYQVPSQEHRAEVNGGNGRSAEFQISDALWAEVEPLLPKRKQSKRRGRPPMDDRQAMTAIFYVLASGCQWKALPNCLGASSTVHGRYLQWRKAGVFERMWEAGVMDHDELKDLALERLSLDGAVSTAPPAVAT